MSAMKQQRVRSTTSHEFSDTLPMSSAHTGESRIPTLPGVHTNKSRHSHTGYAEGTATSQFSNSLASSYPDRNNPPPGMEPGARSSSLYQYDEGDVTQDPFFVDRNNQLHTTMNAGEYHDTEYLRPGHLAARELDAEALRAEIDKTDDMFLDKQPRPAESPNASLELLIAQVERLMREYEQNAQYADAERTRQHLENLKRRVHDFSRRELELLQEEDIRAFFHSVVEQQRKFDRIWAARLVEHKLRADDLISALKGKQQEQQDELYKELQQRRIPRFSVEQLNMRKRQVLLARGKKYVEADEIRRKADQMETVELEKIRRMARKQNAAQFEALLKKQQYERQNLAEKLRDERLRLLELKAQDFLSMRNRQKNAEQALKRTHMKQGLVADGKLAPMFSTLNKQKVVAENTAGQPASGTSLRNLRDKYQEEERKRADEAMLDSLRGELGKLRLMDAEMETGQSAGVPRDDMQAWGLDTVPDQADQRNAHTHYSSLHNHSSGIYGEPKQDKSPLQIANVMGSQFDDEAETLAFNL